MSPLAAVALWAAVFVGTHFLLSHPLRGPLAAKLGERGFGLLYSAVALVTFALMVRSAVRVGPEAPLWTPSDAVWIAASILMWFGTILLVGSLRRNPALPRPGKTIARIDEARGVFAITRHPMMWAFALWAVVHVAIWPKQSTIIMSAAILVLALAGAAGQDLKKDRLMGEPWTDWKARTSFLPFGRGPAAPDMFALSVGTLVFLVATWAHGALGAMPAGPWRWFG